jgi:hypothetical protein
LKLDLRLPVHPIVGGSWGRNPNMDCIIFGWSSQKSNVT